MKIDSKYSGLVTKKFNQYFLVDLKNKENFDNSDRFLCKVRQSINFKNQLIYVGDEVVINNIELKSKRAVITSLKKRKNLSIDQHQVYMSWDLSLKHLHQPLDFSKTLYAKIQFSKIYQKK